MTAAMAPGVDICPHLSGCSIGRGAAYGGETPDRRFQGFRRDEPRESTHYQYLPQTPDGEIEATAWPIKAADHPDRGHPLVNGPAPVFDLFALCAPAVTTVAEPQPATNPAPRISCDRLQGKQPKTSHGDRVAAEIRSASNYRPPQRPVDFRPTAMGQRASSGSGIASSLSPTNGTQRMCRKAIQHAWPGRQQAPLTPGATRATS